VPGEHITRKPNLVPPELVDFWRLFDFAHFKQLSGLFGHVVVTIT
jgi:hypothetical protein